MSKSLLNLCTAVTLSVLLLASGCEQPRQQVAGPVVESERPQPEEAVAQPQEQPPESVVQSEAAEAETAEEAVAEPQEQEPVEPGPSEPPTAEVETAVIALKFSPQDSTVYELEKSSKQNVSWSGDLPDTPEFQGGENNSRLEMTFTQQTESVDDRGSALAKITIHKLRYFVSVKGNVLMDFDSSRPGDKGHFLYGLVGKSYKIKISPAGRVTVVDAGDVRAALAGNAVSSAMRNRIAKLFSDEAIESYHGTLALPEEAPNPLKPGDNWSSVKGFSFGKMGAKSYERIYTLEQIKTENSRKVAVITMSAIPSSEMAAELYQQQGATDIAKGFDHSGEYTGRLEFDLESGKVESYTEQIHSTWVAALPVGQSKTSTEPAVLEMDDIRRYSLRRVR